MPPHVKLGLIDHLQAAGLSYIEVAAFVSPKAVPQMADTVDVSDPEAVETARLAALMPADETQLLYSMCLHGRGELGLAPDEYAALTMVLLRLLAFKPGAGSGVVPGTLGGAPGKSMSARRPASSNLSLGLRSSNSLPT